MKWEGKIHKFGDNIDTDIIIPARFCTTLDKQNLAEHCMFDIRKEFYKTVGENDIIVSGHNFGCGSSREVAPVAIKATGIKCVIAKSFARIFFRNSVNMGLYLIASDSIPDAVETGDAFSIDLLQQTIRVRHTNLHFDHRYDPLINDIVSCNGLINYLKMKNFIV
jgi:3-isopropylmalate/(R)-2-methylmalate dehydratase small subunit